MTDFKQILDSGESEHLEAKSAKGGFPDSLWETYSAFANSDGGTILLGVEESNGKLFVNQGLADAQKMKSTFWNMVNNRQKISHNIVLESGVYVAQIEGKDILAIEVPRAERTVRPVYKGTDPRTGTFRRYGDGDHLCSLEEVGAMLRDASVSPLDAAPVKEVDLSALCIDSVNGYRQMFRSANPNHLWTQLENEIFLRRIKAVEMADDGKYHPTVAGLLMFGYEYEITRHFPLYFLDYQEDRQLIGVTRWKDRVVSSSGDWSGNLFDFMLKILTKLQSDLKVPFVLKGITRIDDTPIHRLVREAATNCLVHADYYGRQGVVISKSKDGFVFANPGGLRISKKEAVSGGVSDPRNATLLKMFSFIRFGERAGSGLNGIMYVWNKVYHCSPTITEKFDVERTILTLPIGDREPDINAMLELYDDYAEIIAPQDGREKNDNNAGKGREENGNDAGSREKNDKNAGNGREKNGSNVESREKILALMEENPTITQSELASAIHISVKAVEKHLKKLREHGIIRRIGPDKGGRWEVLELGN